MTNLISRLIARIRSLLGNFEVKRFLSIVFVGFILLTTGITNSEASSQTLNKKVDKWLSQDNSERPTTTKEWKKEARETEDEPGERIKRIGQQSAEAVKEWGSLYPDVAKRSIPPLQDND
jgi:hypothetical protein